MVSAKLTITNLVSGLTQEEFDILKISEWVNLIHKYSVPVKWYRRSPKGTSVLFRPLLNEKDTTEALQELAKYVGEVNRKYDKKYRIELMPLRVEESE